MPTETGMPEATKQLKEAVKDAALNNTLATPGNATTIAEATVEKVKSDPVATNALNQEPFWQSGVGVFGTGGLIWSIGWLMTEIGEHGTDIAGYGKDMARSVDAVGTIFFFGAVLYRRFMPGLKPLFWRWTTK